MLMASREISTSGLCGNLKTPSKEKSERPTSLKFSFGRNTEEEKSACGEFSNELLYKGCEVIEDWNPSRIFLLTVRWTFIDYWRKINSFYCTWECNDFRDSIFIILMRIIKLGRNASRS